MSDESKAIEASVEQLLASNGITFDAIEIPSRTDGLMDEMDGAMHWIVTFSHGKRTLSMQYTMGAAHRHWTASVGTDGYPQIKTKPKKGERVDVHGRMLFGLEAYLKKWTTATPPIATNVLHSVALDRSALDEPFREWGENFGYDTDSIRAKETYEACVRQGIEANAFFGRELLDQIGEACQDY